MEENVNEMNAQCAFCGEINTYRNICEHISKEHPEGETPAEYDLGENCSDNLSVSEQDTVSERGEWSDEETRFLLDKYHQYLNMVGPMKKYKRKKDMWMQISRDIKIFLNKDKTSLQCENRFKTVMKRKKKAMDNNKCTGASRMDIPYEDELCNIAAVDDSLVPEVKMDQKRVETVIKESVSVKKKQTEKQKSIQEVLLEINKKNLEEKERRHQERLELSRDFCSQFFEKKESKQ